MAEKSITCPPRADPPVADDTFDRLELPPGAEIRISPDVDSTSGIAVMESRRHCEDFFGHYASAV